MIGWLLLLFFLGASVGSFLNVLVVRTVEGGDWVRGRSRCDHCQNNLSWYDMVPLLSFLLLRGKSRCCNKPLAMIHPMVEFLMGALFVWWYVMGSVFFSTSSRTFTHDASWVLAHDWSCVIGSFGDGFGLWFGANNSSLCCDFD